jgi:hypothetical protein
MCAIALFALRAGFSACVQRACKRNVTFIRTMSFPSNLVILADFYNLNIIYSYLRIYFSSSGAAML